MNWYFVYKITSWRIHFNRDSIVKGPCWHRVSNLWPSDTDLCLELSLTERKKFLNHHHSCPTENLPRALEYRCLFSFPLKEFMASKNLLRGMEKNRKAFLSGSVAISEIQFCLEFERKSNFLRVTIIASLVLYIFTIGPWQITFWVLGPSWLNSVSSIQVLVYFYRDTNFNHKEGGLWQACSP